MRRVHVLSDASKKFNKKLAPKYEGPLKIVEIKSPTVYILDSAERGSRWLAMIHVSELKRDVSPRNKRFQRNITNYFFLIMLQDCRCWIFRS